MSANPRKQMAQLIDGHAWALSRGGFKRGWRFPQGAVPGRSRQRAPRRSAVKAPPAVAGRRDHTGRFFNGRGPCAPDGDERLCLKRSYSSRECLLGNSGNSPPSARKRTRPASRWSRHHCQGTAPAHLFSVGAGGLTARASSTMAYAAQTAKAVVFGMVPQSACMRTRSSKGTGIRGARDRHAGVRSPAWADVLSGRRAAVRARAG